MQYSLLPTAYMCCEGAPRLTLNYCVNQTFSTEEENVLDECLQMMTRLHHGLSPKNARKLAKLWFIGFLKRRTECPLRTAEATSLGGAMRFKKPVVERFFKVLGEILRKYDLEPYQICNVNETALATVQPTGKILAVKGQRQVGSTISTKRGTPITMCGAINAVGNHVPPLLIFPRKYYKHHYDKKCTSYNDWRSNTVAQ
ncbi:hypothetical protein ILUMI_15508 [Ignelater luminosus]|uniref:Uncharacterized protein n=1 Tax=Ignelater luminosus TaxID=2038154 RepID=A0A8K0CWD4_IGNLU|nr:hypothetical protein ILUMI_15508 [Ignelater luminosus]